MGSSIILWNIRFYKQDIYSEFQNPIYVMFNYAVIIIIGIFAYCLITKNWNYIDIRKINNKGYFVLQSLLDVLSSIFNRFALLDGNVSMEKLINDRKIVHK